MIRQDVYLQRLQQLKLKSEPKKLGHYLPFLSFKAEQFLRLSNNVLHLVEGPVLNGPVQHLENTI